jgi:hypothetical protein
VDLNTRPPLTVPQLLTADMHPLVVQPLESVSRQRRVSPAVWKMSGTAGRAFEPHAVDEMPTAPAALQQKPPPA